MKLKCDFCGDGIEFPNLDGKDLKDGFLVICYNCEGEEKMLNRIIRAVYVLGRVLSDVRAVKNRKVGKRIGRRYVGRKTGSFLNKLFR